MPDYEENNILTSDYSDEEDIRHQDKKNLLQRIKRLSRQCEQQKTIIHYQREEIQDLNRHLSYYENKYTQKEEIPEEGSLLSLLEAMEEIPRKQGSGKLRQILTDAFLNKNSQYYSIVNTFIVALIFFSVICVTMESVPSLMAKWERFFYWSEIIVVIIFTIEYLINIYVAENKLRYMISLRGIIDLLAILPTYFYMVDLRDIKLARTIRIVRCLRTLRIMRVLKLTKNMDDNYHQSVERINTLKIDLMIYATALFSVIVIFSTLVYYAEHTIPNSRFSSIPAAMWWCLVTITTVGYGDMSPSTIIGKFLAAAAMILGLALFGILMNVIGKAMMTSLFKTSKIK